MKQDHLSWEEELNRLLSEDISLVIEREKKAFDKLTSPLGKSLVLFGAGNLGRQVLAQLRKDGIEPLAFADNKSALWGKYIDGIKVLSPSEAAKELGDKSAFVITIWNTAHSFVETRQELLALNCVRVLSAIPLRWKYSEALLPFFWLDLPSKTFKQRDFSRSAFSLWADEFSRREFLAQLRFRILGDFDSLSVPVPQESYFPDDLFSLKSDEAFVDCGAYDGITVEHFLERQKEFSGRIIAYEPDPANFISLNEYISGLPNNIKGNLLSLPFAISAQRSKVHFDATGTMGSNISDNGSLEVDCVTLDENLEELQFTPTYIKMDIEGAELDALNGARNVIQKCMPILAICLYHRYDDIWRIPLFINSFSSDYRLFLRPHEIEGWQLVCYVVPIPQAV